MGLFLAMSSVFKWSADAEDGLHIAARSCMTSVCPIRLDIPMC